MSINSWDDIPVNNNWREPDPKSKWQRTGSWENNSRNSNGRNSMDSISSSSTMSKIKTRDMTVYQNLDEIENPNLRKFVETVGKQVEYHDMGISKQKGLSSMDLNEKKPDNFGYTNQKDDYGLGKKSYDTKVKESAYKNSQQTGRAYNINDKSNIQYDQFLQMQESKSLEEKYKKEASEIVKTIDVNTLSAKDYKRLADVACNVNNQGDNLEDATAKAMQVRQTIENMGPDNTSKCLYNAGPVVLNRFMNEALKEHPDKVPKKADLQPMAEKISNELLSKEPRIDFTNDFLSKSNNNVMSNSIMKAVNEKQTNIKQNTTDEHNKSIDKFNSTGFKSFSKNDHDSAFEF